MLELLVTLVTPVTAAESLAFPSPVGRSSSGDAAETGDRPPAWTDDSEWARRIGKARQFGDKVRLVAAWAEAAGGGVSTVNEALHLHLPPGLPNCLALAELRRFADQFHLRVTTGGRA